MKNRATIQEDKLPKKPLEKDVCFLVDTLFIPKGANFLKKSNNYEMKYTTTPPKSWKK